MSLDQVNEIVGVDPGFTECGVFCLTPGGHMTRYIVIKSESTMMKVKCPEEMRASEVARLAFNWVNEVPGVKVIGCEGPSYGSRSSSMEQLAYCRQSIYDMARFFLPDFYYYRVAPTSVKKIVCGSGKATKEDVAHTISEKFDIEVKQYGITDAAGVALSAWKLWSDALEGAMQDEFEVGSDVLPPERRPRQDGRRRHKTRT